ncbi:aryl-alcohol dehydrogenase-like predicted oxidoreductase [Micromonospora kangleipakensis]|uniref:Aryl-alcohol dehydrogenase-like predicted oxidoreductase n=1 Tax=Micromonospora kangleipakensis TaxID=1077942 RepID=A0A4Q8B800_9ACTN|nr:aldo/keto reductase [Micromonospora kangleipakensis]RZU73814.1 aryl-alcohol dehydrogenase-like predicted oxidoreductase [Micromonospora kangleipakensis]
MRSRAIGDVPVSAIGLGAMPLSIEGRPAEDRAIATIHAALDAGVTLIDTADSYHWYAGEAGHNEELIAKALAGHPGAAEVLVATKGGRGRPGDGSWTVTATPEHLRRACDASLRRLGVEAIGLYQLHKPDPEIWPDSVGAVRDLVDAGKVRMAGVSNVTVDQLRQARKILGDRLVAVQNRYSPAVRDSEPVLQLCHDLGLAFLPWSPLGGISRSSLDDPSGPASTGTAFHAVAAEHGVSPQRVCLAWLLARSPMVVPIPGASRPATIRDSAAAADLLLDPADLARLDATELAISA